ncbi:MAG: hypothetical protein ACEQR8_01760 [Cypionkella sp.]
MSAILAAATAAGLLVSAPPVPPVQAVDAAYEEVVNHRNGEAIARIESDRPAAHAHPAQLINLGLAYAREGNVARARELLRRAASADEIDTLETADGQWASARVLARRALAALDRSSAGVRTARR